MRPRAALLLTVLAAMVVAAAWWFGQGPDSVPITSAPEGTLAFPGLADRLRQATEIDITGDGRAVTMRRRGPSPDAGPGAPWGVVQRDLYPVVPRKLRALLTGLTELRLMERRTADPAELGAIGLADPAAKGSTAILLRVLGAGGQPIAALLLGHRRMRMGGGVPEEVFVRRPGQTQSWLAEGAVEADDDPASWIDRDILNIAAARIAAVSSARGSDAVTLTRTGETLVVTAPPDHPPVDPDHVDDVANALEFLTLTDVRAGALPGHALGRATFTTTDGVAVRVDGAEDGATLWIAVSATGDGPAAVEAEAIAARTRGWAYAVGGWKKDALLPDIATLAGAPVPPPPMPTPPAPTPPFSGGDK